MFWDYLGSVFTLHDLIMHALYSYMSFYVRSFEFRGSSHASGAIFPCIGCISMVIWAYFHIFYSLIFAGLVRFHVHPILDI